MIGGPAVTDLTLDAYQALPLGEIEERLREERRTILGLDKGSTARTIADSKEGFLFDRMKGPLRAPRRCRTVEAGNG